MGRHRQHVKYTHHYKFLFDSGEKIICGICSLEIIKKDQISVDHIHPQSLGGKNHAYNFRPAHTKCNSRLGNKNLIIKGQP